MYGSKILVTVFQLLLKSAKPVCRFRCISTWLLTLLSFLTQFEIVKKCNFRNNRHIIIFYYCAKIYPLQILYVESKLVFVEHIKQMDFTLRHL